MSIRFHLILSTIFAIAGIYYTPAFFVQFLVSHSIIYLLMVALWASGTYINSKFVLENYHKWNE